MNNTSMQRSAAGRATDRRFLEVVVGEGAAYPADSEFVAADLRGLAQVIERNLREQRASVIVHDDGSEIVIEPPELGRLARGIMLLLGIVLPRDRRIPKVEAGSEAVQLPVGSRVQLRRARIAA